MLLDFDERQRHNSSNWTFQFYANSHLLSAKLKVLWFFLWTKKKWMWDGTPEHFSQNFVVRRKCLQIRYPFFAVKMVVYVELSTSEAYELIHLIYDLIIRSQPFLSATGGSAVHWHWWARRCMCLCIWK